MQNESLQLGCQEKCRAIKVIGASDFPGEVLEIGEYIGRRPELLEDRENAGRDVVGELVVSYLHNSSAVFEDFVPVFLFWRRTLRPGSWSTFCANEQKRTLTRPRPGLRVFFNLLAGNRPMIGTSESDGHNYFHSNIRKMH